MEMYRRSDCASSNQLKKRKFNCDMKPKDVLPTLHSSDYYTIPSIEELAVYETTDPGYCGRVPDFVVGRLGYGCIHFLSNTDVRMMSLDKIVKFSRQSVIVYEDDADKPPVGFGLNKAAIVTLVLEFGQLISDACYYKSFINRLKSSTCRQGAHFISFDPSTCEWKFSVEHFSRFGLDDEEEDVPMDDVAEPIVEEKTTVVEPIVDVKDTQLTIYPDEPELPHSLPTHLGLDPVRMREMRMIMFPNDDEVGEEMDRWQRSRKYHWRETMKIRSPSSMENSLQRNGISSSRDSMKIDSPGLSSNDTALHSPQHIPDPITRNAPYGLLEYNVNSSEQSPSDGILMTGSNKGFSLRMTKLNGFKMGAKDSSPVSSKNFSNCVVDAALLMGRSFRVGWGPNGILVHTGSLVHKPGNGLSSVINIEKVAVDKVARDAKNKLKDELIELNFCSLMNLHKSFDRDYLEVQVESFKFKLQKVVMRRTVLPDICEAYVQIIEKHLELADISPSSRVLLMHQVAVWKLINVLFSERETSEMKLKRECEGDEMMMDGNEELRDIDPEALPLIRRAEFSNWLQDSVCHRVQDDVSSLGDSRYLEHILFLLTGRQVDAATELAASRGDIRLAILLSHAGGSMVNRSDIAQQLEIWKINGLDSNFIEKERIKIYELLAGNINDALEVSAIDWKRYLGLIMWYQLQPDISLGTVFQTYQQLLDEGKVPHPVPVYIDEGPLDEDTKWTAGGCFDLSYYLMLLHANGKDVSDHMKTMFSAFSSSYDPLDFHMIWHQRSILEAVGAFCSADLHVLDISLVHQLLCLGQCHWAIYVVVNMSYLDHVQCNQAKLIKEILSQYCTSWSSDAELQHFIQDLGIPTAWMHEALAVYSEYYGDQPKALEYFIKSGNWKKAHSIFMSSVAHSLFLSSKHSEIWRIASAMENYQSEIAEWDLGAGMFLDFYMLKTSLQEENVASDLNPLEEKNEACRSFFSRLNDSLLVWSCKLPIEARATFSKMTEEICGLLLSSSGENSPTEIQLKCFQTIFGAPVPGDFCASRLQEAVSVFTFGLSSVTY